MKPIRIGQLVTCSLIAAAYGCGGSEPPPRSITETTSGAVPSVSPREVTDAQENAARAERERDEARQQTEVERARRDREVQALRERSEFEGRIRKQLDSTDDELRKLEDIAARGSAATRTRVDDLWKKRDDVERLLRRSSTESTDAWPSFKTEVGTAVEDLKKSVMKITSPGATRP
jgi:hypothetical protein